MKRTNASAWGAFISVMLIGGAACAQGAPGEDPVRISNRVSYLQMPTAPRSVSTSIVYRTGMPEDAKAKIAHYVARAYAPDTGNVQTNNDVVSSVQTNSMGGTTCVQTLQPTTAAGASGAKGKDQVVVIRGDLVNICR